MALQKNQLFWLQTKAIADKKHETDGYFSH